MAFRIQSRSWKNADGTTSKSWRLIIEDYSVKDQRTSIYPPKHEYRKYGFDPDDPIEKAKEKLKILQAQQKVVRHAERQAKIHKRLRVADTLESAFLPKKIYAEFLDFLCDRRAWATIPVKTESHLRCMRKVILDLKMDPAEWPRRAGKIYSWFINEGLSASYLEKVLPLLNEYGYFYCREMGTSFLPIPMPPNRIREQVNDSNAESRNGHSNESLPLRPEHFEKLSKMKPEQALWLERSLYLGLRPEEIDSLTPENMRTNPKQLNKYWFVEYDKTGTPILAVYQSKLANLPRHRRWKRIPCILKKQQELVQGILDGAPTKRPYGKYVRKHIGDGYTLWAGRKGFKPLMRAYGQTEFNIHRWEGRRDFRELDAAMRDQPEQSGQNYLSPKAVSMALGHSGLERTDRNYDDPTEVDYDQVTEYDSANTQ